MLSTVRVTPNDSDFVSRSACLQQFRLIHTSTIASTILRISTTGCMRARQSPYEIFGACGIWCVEEVGNYHGQEGQKCGFDSSRNKYIFGSGSLLCQGPRRRHKETAWKRRQIKTSLVVVMYLLRVITYVIFYKLFWNWIGVMRFVSHEVWFDTGFIIWHFLHCCFKQTVSLWLLGTWIWIIFNTNESVN